MVKLSSKLLNKRKKFVAAIIAMIAISAMLSAFSNITASSICKQKKELAIKTYGVFICGANGLSSEVVNKIKKCEEIKSGLFELYSNVTLKDSTFTMGYGDDNFLSMSNAVLEEGEMPTKDNEVVVERFVAQMYEISKPGQTIEIKINGINKKVYVTGMVRNYSNQLSVNCDLEKGKNNYPNILCSKDNSMLLADGEKKISVLFGFNDFDEIGFDQIATIGKMRNIISGENLDILEEEIYQNDNLYNRGLLYCIEIQIFGTLFSVILLIITVCCGFNLLRVFYRGYEKKIAIFNTCGLTRKQGLCIILIQLLFFMVSSGILSICSFAFINCIVGKVLFANIISGVSFMDYIVLIVWYGVLFASLVFLLYQIYKNIYQKSISFILSNDVFCVVKKIVRRPLNFNIIKCISKPKIGNVLILTAFFSVCFISMFIFYTAQDDYSDLPDYDLISKEVTVSESIKGYNIQCNSESYFTNESVEKLKKFGDDISVDAEPNLNGNTLLFNNEKVPEYFKRWTLEYEISETDVKDSIIEKNWPKNADNMYPIPEVDVIVADKELIKDISEKYSLNVDVKNMIAENGAILFLPDVKDSENTGLKTGDIIGLGGVNLYGDDVTFVQSDIKTFGIVYAPYEFVFNNYKQQRENITIVVSDKYARNELTINGLNKLTVYVDSNLNTNELQEIDNCINAIQSQVQGGILYSKKATMEAQTTYSTYVRMLGIALILIIICSGFIYIYNQICNYIHENKMVFGILRALGLSTKELSDRILLSYIDSMLISFIVDAVIVVLFFYNNMSIKMMISNLIISYLIVFVMVILVKVVLIRLIKKIKIQEMIRS